MSDFLQHLESGALLADGAMGSYLFELTGRLSESRHLYEAMNINQPDLVERVHGEYLAAGARCLKTNTFGANRIQLAPHGLADRCGEINRAGVALARKAAKASAAGDDQPKVFVLGSIGPAEAADTGGASVEVCYRDQVEALVDAGADALLLETFRSLPELLEIPAVIQTFSQAPPVIAEMTTGDSHGVGMPAPEEFFNSMAGAGASVAGINCCAPWEAEAFVEKAVETAAVKNGRVHLSVMPNAGGFQRIGNRFMSSVNPEYAGQMARRLVERGVRLMGGCCEMHPPHIREMSNYLRSGAPRQPMLETTGSSGIAPAGREEKRANGPFSRKLFNGEFTVSVELLPPRGTDERVIRRKADFVRDVADSGLADAVDITDGSRGIPLMPPADFIHYLRGLHGWDQAGGDRLELIPHFTARDLNTMGIQSRLIGFHANRIHNILFVTGDPPKMSPTYPPSTAVFDTDSPTLIKLAHACLNAGVDFGGRPLGRQADPRTHFTIGTGFEPEALDLSEALKRLGRKLEHGADYVMTQPVFHTGPLTVLEPYRSRVPILIGVMVLRDLEQAQRVAQVPGVVIPDGILERMAKGKSPDDQAKIGCDIAIEQVREVVREGWSGLYLMSPGGTAPVLQVLGAGL